MLGLGTGEMLLVVGIILLFFGGKKLPQLGSSFGKAIQNFKSSMKEGKEIDEKEDNS